MILLFWLFLKMHLIRNLVRESFRNKAYRNCSGFAPRARTKLKVGWRHVSLLPQKSAVSVRMERRLADCVVAPCIIHVRMELQNPQQSIQKPRRKDSVPQRAADFSNFVFCWCKTFPPPISETNYWYILIITLHPDSSPWICKLIQVIRVLATVGVKCNNFMVSTH